MVRNYKKKTDRKPNTPRKLRKGLELLKQGYSLRVAAKEANVNYACLFRLSKKTKDCKTDSEISDDALRLSHNSRSIFTNAMEESIAQYCTDMALIGYGLTTLKVRELAYETAMINKVKVPDSWTKETIAGLDWLHGKSLHLIISKYYFKKTFVIIFTYSLLNFICRVSETTPSAIY